MAVVGAIAVLLAAAVALTPGSCHVVRSPGHAAPAAPSPLPTP